MRYFGALVVVDSGEATMMDSPIEPDDGADSSLPSFSSSDTEANSTTGMMDE